MRDLWHQLAASQKFGILEAGPLSFCHNWQSELGGDEGRELGWRKRVRTAAERKAQEPGRSVWCEPRIWPGAGRGGLLSGERSHVGLSVWTWVPELASWHFFVLAVMAGSSLDADEGNYLRSKSFSHFVLSSIPVLWHLYLETLSHQISHFPNRRYSLAPQGDQSVLWISSQ